MKLLMFAVLLVLVSFAEVGTAGCETDVSRHEPECSTKCSNTYSSCVAKGGTPFSQCQKEMKRCLPTCCKPIVPRAESGR